jgi:hypothetical protein
MGFAIERSSIHTPNGWMPKNDSLPVDKREYSCNMQDVAFVYRGRERYKIVCRLFSDQQNIKIFVNPVLKKGNKEYGLVAGVDPFKFEDNWDQVVDSDSRFPSEYLIDFAWPKMETYRSKGDYVLSFRLGTTSANSANSVRPSEWKTQNFAVHITENIPHQ